MGLHLQLNQLIAQHTVAGVLVLELGALLLAGHDDAGGLVDQSDGGRGLVDVLTTGAGGTEHLHFHVLGADLHLHVVGQVGHDLNGGKGGLAAGIGVEGRDAHQAVDTVLPPQVAVGVLAGDHNGGGLDAGLVAVLIVQRLPLEALALRPAGVHAEEHAGPVLRLGTAGTGMDGEHAVQVVVLAGEQGGKAGLLQILYQMLVALFHLGHKGLVLHLLTHLAQGEQILQTGLALFVVVDLIL